MAVTNVQNGTAVLLILGTEMTIGTVITTAGVYVLTVNLGTLANGETTRVRAYEKTLTGDASSPVAANCVYDVSYSHVQGAPIKASPPIVTMYDLAFTLTQTGGTLNMHTWRIDSVG